MKSPICVSKICVTNRKQTASFSIAGLMLAIAPLWLMLAFGSPANAQTSTTDTSPNWTQFHRDNMQRWNPYETVLGVGNVGSLQLKWKSIPIGNAQDDSNLESSPAVVNGVVYAGSYGNNVYALNAETGALLWNYATSGTVYSSPAVANGVVYVLSNSNECCSVFALIAGTGALLWSAAVPEGSQNSPTVANGVVYDGSNDGDLYGFNASTGASVFAYGAGGTPAVVNGVLYTAGSYGHNVYALNASTSALLWSYTPGGGVQSSPAVANGVVYIGSDDGNVYALNASTGAKLWSYTTGNAISYSSPAVANGVVYIGSEDNNVYALNASTGAKLWSYDIGAFSSSPAIVDGVLYIHAGGASGGNVYAFALCCSSSGSADLFLRVQPTPTTVQQGDLLTYAFPVWNLGPDNADYEVLTTQVPEGTTLDYVRISGTPGLGTCITPPYGGTGEIVCYENSAMAPNTTWTVRVVVKVTAPSGTVITESATTTAETPDPNLANNTGTVSLTVQ